MNTVQKVLNKAEAEKGYLEKKNNSQLDSKTANAGSGNFTKYWRDVYPSFQGEPWCMCFVVWSFIQTFGIIIAKKLLCVDGGWTFYTPTAASYFKDKGQWYTKNPQAGDIIFFKNSERICHVGIVKEVKGNTVTTIEGNTSIGSEVIPNGGGVYEKSYQIQNSRIAGYGRPLYDDEVKSTYPIGWNMNAENGKWWYQYGTGKDDYYKDRVVRINDAYYAFGIDGYMKEESTIITMNEKGEIIGVQ